MTLEEKAPIVLLLAKAIGQARDAKDWRARNYFNGAIEGLGLALGKGPVEIDALQIHHSVFLTGDSNASPLQS